MDAYCILIRAGYQVNRRGQHRHNIVNLERDLTNITNSQTQREKYPVQKDKVLYEKK